MMKSVTLVLILSMYLITVEMTDSTSYTTRTSVKTTTDYHTTTVNYPKFRTEKPWYDLTQDYTELEPNFNIICKTCYCNSRKKYVNCEECGLTTWYDNADWEKLDNQFPLEMIIMSENAISYIPILPSMKTRRVTFRNNRIESIESGAFKNLKYLEELDLSYNRLTKETITSETLRGDFHPYEYDELKNLTIINLENNKINGLFANTFDYVPNLEKLILDGNPFLIIDSATTSAIKNNANLQFLSLNQMQLLTLPNDLFENLNRLKTLYLAKNNFVVIPDALRLAENLMYLNLDDNPIKIFDARNSFPKLERLGTLSISYMKELMAIEEYSFNLLTNLTTLYCSNNAKLTEFDMTAFGRNQNHYYYQTNSRFYLSHNNLSVIKNFYSYSLDNHIVEFDIRVNPLECTCETQNTLNRIMSTVLENTPYYSEDIVCGGPENLKGIQVEKIIKGDLVQLCHRIYYPPNHVNPFLIALISGVGGFIAIIFVLYLVYKCGYMNLRKRIEATTPEYQRIEEPA